jgi:hypothetical protein
MVLFRRLTWILILVFGSFTNDLKRNIFFIDYDTYVTLYNCSDIIKVEIGNSRKLSIKPSNNCRDLYIKCYKVIDNSLLEEGMYRCTTSKIMHIHSENDKYSSIIKRRYFMTNG